MTDRKTENAPETALQLLVGMFRLFVPIVLSRISFLGMKLTDTALVGHAGTAYLSASALSDFWTQSSGVFLAPRGLNSLCGQAYGAKNYQLVGTWLFVALFLLSWALVPVFLLWVLTEPILLSVGVENQLAADAGYYATVLALCLPAKFVQQAVLMWLGSIKITSPAVVSTALCLTMNLVLGLQFVLGIPFGTAFSFGFYACPAVTATVEYIACFVVVFYYCGYKNMGGDCRPDWNTLKTIKLSDLAFLNAKTEPNSYVNKEIKPRMGEFFQLWWPSALALGSDIWRMSAIGAVSGTLGALEVGVYSSSYRLAWLNLTVVGSFSQAAVTYMNIALGRGDGEDAKRIISIGITFVLTFLCITVVLTMVFITQLGSIFSSDPAVLDLFTSSRYEMGLMIFFMCLSMHFEIILLGLQRPDTVLKAGLAGSWLGQVPLVLLLTTFVGFNLQNVYLGVAGGYFLLNLLYMLPVLSVDWDAEAAKVKAKMAKDGELNEPLIVDEEKGDEGDGNEDEKGVFDLFDELLGDGTRKRKSKSQLLMPILHESGTNINRINT